MTKPVFLNKISVIIFIPVGLAILATVSACIPSTSPPLPTAALPTQTSTLTNTRTPTPSFTPTISPTATLVESIFADNFEGGDLSRWSSASTDNVDLSVAAEAALEGNYGLKVIVNDNTNIGVYDGMPENEPRYRARFYINLNSISIPVGATISIFEGWNAASLRDFWVQVYSQDPEDYQMRAGIRTDDGLDASTAYYPIAIGVHAVEIDYQASSMEAAGDGHYILWIDGVEQEQLTGLDNDTKTVDYIRLGFFYAGNPGINGIIYFDDFVSDRTQYIGYQAQVLGR